MDDADVAFRTRVLLNLQGCLLGRVTPNLRYVLVGGDVGAITARFVYATAVHEEELEEVSEAETEVVADLWTTTSVTFTHEVSDEEKPTGTGEDLVFLRKER